MTHPLLSGFREVLDDLTAAGISNNPLYLQAWLLNKTALGTHLNGDERAYFQARYDALYPLDRPAPTPELTPDEPVTTEPTPAEVAEPEPTPAQPVAAEPTINPQGDVTNV